VRWLRGSWNALTSPNIQIFRQKASFREKNEGSLDPQLTKVGKEDGAEEIKRACSGKKILLIGEELAAVVAATKDGQSDGANVGRSSAQCSEISKTKNQNQKKHKKKKIHKKNLS